jgi:hypothetical protein
VNEPRWRDLYDFPISHEHYRALCQMYGEPIPPSVDNRQYLTDEEYEESFIRWQEEQRKLVFGGKPIFVPPPVEPEAPLPRPTPAVKPKRLKGIDI